MPRWRWNTEKKEWVEIDEIRIDPNAGLNGPVYCPENGYFDMVLNKKFESKEEKRMYMREKGLKMENKYHPKDKRGVIYFYK
jgi:hypothetical protein